MCMILGKYVGSAFLIRDINYLCHFPKVEEGARTAHHYLSFFFFFFFWCLMGRDPGPFARAWLRWGSKGGFREIWELSVWFVSSGGGLGECEDQKAWRDSPNGTLVTRDTISQSWNVPSFLTLVVAHCQC